MGSIPFCTLSGVVEESAAAATAAMWLMPQEAEAFRCAEKLHERSLQNVMGVSAGWSHSGSSRSKKRVVLPLGGALLCAQPVLGYICLKPDVADALFRQDRIFNAKQTLVPKIRRWLALSSDPSAPHSLAYLFLVGNTGI